VPHRAFTLGRTNTTFVTGSILTSHAEESVWHEKFLRMTEPALYEVGGSTLLVYCSYDELHEGKMPSVLPDHEVVFDAL
jgi:hypothetical protein